MPEFWQDDDGFRYCLTSPAGPNNEEQVATVFTANWIVDWEDVQCLQRYRIHLSYGLKSIQWGDESDFQIQLNANGLKRKTFRLGDLVAQWVPTGFYTIEIEDMDVADPQVATWFMYVE